MHRPVVKRGGAFACATEDRCSSLVHFGPLGGHHEEAFSATALAAAFAQPVSAVTFPSLTTIYVASGVLDSGNVNFQGEATSIQCSNVSGVEVQVRALVLTNVGRSPVRLPSLCRTELRRRFQPI